MYPLRHSHLKPPSLLMQSCEQVPGIAHSSTSKIAKTNQGLDFLPNLNFSQLYFWIGNETKRKRNLKRSEDGERKRKVVFLEFCACAKSKSCRQFSPTKKAEEKKLWQFCLWEQESDLCKLCFPRVDSLFYRHICSQWVNRYTVGHIRGFPPVNSGYTRWFHNALWVHRPNSRSRFCHCTRVPSECTFCRLRHNQILCPNRIRSRGHLKNPKIDQAYIKLTMTTVSIPLLKKVHLLKLESLESRVSSLNFRLPSP